MTGHDLLVRERVNRVPAADRGAEMPRARRGPRG